MRNLFDYDSGVMRILTKLSDWVLLGLFWIVFSLPVFTIGTSSTALYYAVNKSLAEDRGNAVSCFLEGFKENFKQTTKLWLPILLVYFLGIMDFALFYKAGGGDLFSQVSVLIVGAAMFAVSLWIVYLFPYMARFSDDTKTTMKNSALIAAAHLPWTLLLLIILIISVVISLLIPMVSIFMPVACTFLSNKILERILKKYIPTNNLGSS